MNLYCMGQVPKNMRIEKNKQIAMDYIETIPGIKPEIETVFFDALFGTINTNDTVSFVKRTDIEKDYVYKRISGMKTSDDASLEIKALELLDEFDNLVCQQIASGLFESSNSKNEIFVINDSKYDRVKKSLLNDNGPAYMMGQKK